MYVLYQRKKLYVINRPRCLIFITMALYNKGYAFKYWWSQTNFYHVNKNWTRGLASYLPKTKESLVCGGITSLNWSWTTRKRSQVQIGRKEILMIPTKSREN